MGIEHTAQKRRVSECRRHHHRVHVFALCKLQHFRPAGCPATPAAAFASVSGGDDNAEGLQALVEIRLLFGETSVVVGENEGEERERKSKEQCLQTRQTAKRSMPEW